MTRGEFESYYATKAGTTVEQLRSYGRVVVKCRCGEGNCKGWASINKEFAEEEEARWLEEGDENIYST